MSRLGLGVLVAVPLFIAAPAHAQECDRNYR